MPEVTIHALPQHTYAVEASNGRQVFVSDEPAAAGGDDLGPSPQELLITALGACVAITLRMYANHKQWPVEDIAVQLSIENVVPAEPDFTAAEIAEAAGEKRPLIRSNVSVTGDLSPEQMARLQEIAGRCPVHRVLRARPAIVTTLTHGA
jgi:uncharacterized OsmC-like protein